MTQNLGATLLKIGVYDTKMYDTKCKTHTTMYKRYHIDRIKKIFPHVPNLPKVTSQANFLMTNSIFFCFFYSSKFKRPNFLAMVVYLQVGSREGPKTIIGKFKP